MNNPLGFGYIITDEQGFLQLHTLRSNRAACWGAFCGKHYTEAKEDHTRLMTRTRLKKMGFRCVFVAVLTP